MTRWNDRDRDFASKCGVALEPELAEPKDIEAFREMFREQSDLEVWRGRAQKWHAVAHRWRNGAIIVSLAALAALIAVAWAMSVGRG